jgi:hypothetical protein
MKRIIVAFSILAMSIGSASAQINESYKATLKKMLAVAGTEQTFDIAIKQLFGMFKQQKTNVPENVWSEFEQEFAKTSIDELVNMLAPVYYNHMTETDLQKMIEFYETPVGKKYAEKTPLIMQESMQVGQEWGIKMGQQFQEKLKEKGY